MIHDDERSFIEIKNLTQFFGEADFIRAVPWLELFLAAEREQFLRVGFDVARLAHGQTQGRSTEDVGDESELLTIPDIEVRARSGRERQFI